MIKKLLFLLVLLLTATTGAWAQTTINVTAGDLGKAVCTDGSIYDDANAAKSAGKTAAAKIICLDTQNSKALALSLDNQAVEPSPVNYATAQSRCEALNTTLAVTFGTWVLPSKAQWEAMIEAAGGYSALRDDIGSFFGGTKMEQVTYWSSTAGTTGHWRIDFNDGDWEDGTDESSARACLVINLPQTYSVTLAEGTEDAENWTVPAEAEEGATVTVTYGGDRKVKSVKAVKKATAYAANEYNEGSWDSTNKKVVFTKQTAASVTALTNKNTGDTWSAGWYTVSGNVTITGNVTLTADTHLILQDHAILTINGQLDCRTNNKNLYIYGQKKGDGKLIVNNSGNAIYSKTGYHIDIHGGEVTASAAGNLKNGLFTGYLAVYGGKLTATSGGGNGIVFYNTIDVYGGEVVATSNATSASTPLYGISNGGDANRILTVYGDKVTATGNGKENYGFYGSGFSCHVKSGASGIKFYFSADGTTWGDGTGYASATSVGLSESDAATKKRYAKAE